MLALRAHRSASYPPRTFENAEQSDVTIALALDYATAGEKLTHRAAGTRYLALPLTMDPVEAARLLWAHLNDLDKLHPTVNVAGNGIYSLLPRGWSQARLNAHLYQVLGCVHTHLPLGMVRSGGQTGVDTAGLVAAIALNIPALGLWPAQFLQRDAQNVEIRSSEETLRAALMEDANRLRAQFPDGPFSRKSS